LLAAVTATVFFVLAALTGDESLPLAATTGAVLLLLAASTATDVEGPLLSSFVAGPP
jgi:hypothetical protein